MSALGGKRTLPPHRFYRLPVDLDIWWAAAVEPNGHPVRTSEFNFSTGVRACARLVVEDEGGTALYVVFEAPRLHIHLKFSDVLIP